MGRGSEDTHRGDRTCRPTPTRTEKSFRKVVAWPVPKPDTRCASALQSRSPKRVLDPSIASVCVRAAQRNRIKRVYMSVQRHLTA